MWAPHKIAANTQWLIMWVRAQWRKCRIRNFFYRVRSYFFSHPKKNHQKHDFFYKMFEKNMTGHDRKEFQSNIFSQSAWSRWPHSSRPKIFGHVFTLSKYSSMSYFFNHHTWCFDVLKKTCCRKYFRPECVFYNLWTMLKCMQMYYMCLLWLLLILYSIKKLEFLLFMCSQVP